MISKEEMLSLISAYNALIEEIEGIAFAHIQTIYSSRVQPSISHTTIEGEVITVHYETYCMSNTEREELSFTFDDYLSGDLAQRLNDYRMKSIEEQRQKDIERAEQRRQNDLEKARKLLQENGELV